MNDPRTPTRHPELVSESIGKFTVLYPCVIKLAALNTDARLSFLSHRWRLAAKWTLKRVQGDVNFIEMCRYCQLRHPELVSGPIAQLPLRYRWETQPNRQINPMRVCRVNQVDLPRAMPILQLLLTRNGGLHRAEGFKMHKAMDRISGSMAGGQITTMLRQTFEQIRRNADVQRAVKLACKYIYARLLFLSHQWSLAAKWTLKQVQGDDLGNQTRYFTKIYVTLNLFQGLSSMGQPTARSTHD